MNVCTKPGLGCTMLSGRLCLQYSAIFLCIAILIFKIGEQAVCFGLTRNCLGSKLEENAMSLRDDETFFSYFL